MADGATRRLLRCAHQHEFATEERAVGWRLDTDIRVRQSGNGKLQPKSFDAQRLHDELLAAVSSRLTAAEIDDVVQGAVLQLSMALPRKSQPVSPEEWEQEARKHARRPALRWIWDYEITDALEQQLRRRENRIAHVLYAVSIRGRTDVGSARRKGFRKAEDILDWIFSREAYPKLYRVKPTRPTPPMTEWIPTRPDPQQQPQWVVKREGNVTRFYPDRLQKSVRHALLGRENGERLSEFITWWVLHGLHGQRRVTSAQLGTAVLNTLRSVDDIAYLRWVTEFKDLRSVADYVDEALTLIEYPSPKLDFASDSASYETRSVVVGVDESKSVVVSDDGVRRLPS